MRIEQIETSLERFGESAKRGIHTASPGYIESYDPKKKTATVIIPITDFLEADGEEPTNLDWAPIPDCPVLFFRAGGWSMTAPLKKGDPVLVIFCQRSIDEWFFSDGKTIVSPALTETHTESDCIVIAGLFPQKNKDGEANDTDLIISHTDSKVRLALKPGGVVDMTCTRLNIGAPSASGALAKATTADNNDTTIQVKVDILASLFGVPPIGALPSTASGKAFTND